MTEQAQSVPQEVAQKVFDSILSQQFQDVIPHLTMDIVQKLMEMIQGPTMDIEEVIEEFNLRKTKVTVEGMTVIYNTPPAKLITEWVYVDDNFKMNDFSHKINWFWLILNFFKVKKFKAKMEEAKAQKAST